MPIPRFRDCVSFQRPRKQSLKAAVDGFAKSASRTTLKPWLIEKTTHNSGWCLRWGAESFQAFSRRCRISPIRSSSGIEAFGLGLGWPHSWPHSWPILQSIPPLSLGFFSRNAQAQKMRATKVSTHKGFHKTIDLEKATNFPLPLQSLLAPGFVFGLRLMLSDWKNKK